MKKSFLDNMPMPSKASKKPAPAPEMDEISEEDLESGEEEAAPSPFADATDDELLEEARRRGLQVSMPPASEESGEDPDFEEEGLDLADEMEDEEEDEEEV